MKRPLSCSIHILLFLSTQFLLAGGFALWTAEAWAQSIDKPLYMGKAATGESLWYYGGRAQCGDLPRNHRCWKNPMIMYKLGGEEFNTILDCQKKTFAEARSITNGKVYRNVTPSSVATKKMVNMACSGT